MSKKLVEERTAMLFYAERLELSIILQALCFRHNLGDCTVNELTYPLYTECEIHQKPVQ